MRKVVLLRQAQEDLDRIYDPLFSEIVKGIELLKEYPYYGAPMEGPLMEFRCFVVGIFRVIYKVLPNDVLEIAYIRHSRRELKP